MGSVGDMDVGGDGGWVVDGYVNGYCGSDWDMGECEGDGVEQELELEHDVSRSTR